MKKETKPYTQMYLMIRLLAGGYLLYTAWNLRDGFSEDPLLIAAAAVFTVIGLALAAHAGWKLYKKEYEGGKPHNDESAEEESV